MASRTRKDNKYASTTGPVAAPARPTSTSGLLVGTAGAASSKSVPAAGSLFMSNQPRPYQSGPTFDELDEAAAEAEYERRRALVFHNHAGDEVFLFCIAIYLLIFMKKSTFHHHAQRVFRPRKKLFDSIPQVAVAPVTVVVRVSKPSASQQAPAVCTTNLRCQNQPRCGRSRAGLDPHHAAG